MSQGTYDILLVEDSKPIREILHLALESVGYAVREASDGADALSILDNEPHPRLIILDLLMPNMDGFEFLRRVQGGSRQSIASIPVIVMSAVAKSAVGKLSGVCEILSKPVKLDHLFLSVQRNLAPG